MLSVVVARGKRYDAVSENMRPPSNYKYLLHAIWFTVYWERHQIRLEVIRWEN
jgi:hypothetical protein